MSRRSVKVLVVAAVATLAAIATVGCEPVAHTISIAASPSGTVAVGSSVKVTGKVSPAASGGTVVVERLVSGTWQSRATATLSGSSTYSITIKPSEQATYKLRTRWSSNGATATSPTLTLVAARAPDAPSAITALAGDAAATVSWSAGQANGAPVTRFDVASSPGTTKSVSGSARSLVFTGLANGATYAFQVRACNAVGCSAWSSSATVVPHTTPTVTVSKGASLSTPDCTISACARVVVALTGFAAGSHTIQCTSDEGGSYATFYTYSTSSTTSQDCYYGYTGKHVRITVDGTYQSNTLTW